ncbi:MAG: AarF/UbiB family protein [Planctomycetota bacterium]
MRRSITSIPQLYRNVRRWTEIVSVLSKYGLADWLSRFNIDFIKDRLKAPDGEKLSRLTQAARIRLALTELGPTFIKFGQLMATRPDVIGPELADELSNLLSDAPADDYETIREIVEGEQGRPLEELFSSFEQEPLASASIGQVHSAELAEEYELCLEHHINGSWQDIASSWLNVSANRNGAIEDQLETDDDPAPSRGALPGSEVVVKVRHEGIERVVETDLDIMAGLATLAERIDEFKNYQPVKMVREMSRTMRRELDLERELRNLQQFRAIFESDSTVAIPAPVPQLCSSRMITMEKFVGGNLKEIAGSPDNDLDLPEIARQGADLYLKMIFHHGFFHADPHPGNILILPDGRIGLFDFGMVGRISEQLREDIGSMLVAIVHQDVPMLTTLIKRIGHPPLELDESALSNDVADFVGHYSTQVLSQFDMSGALVDFVAIVRRHQITLPAEASLLIKVLIQLEGTGRLLDPDFSLMEIMKPFQRLLMLKRLSPARQLRKVRRFYMQAEQLAESLPTRISNILEQIQSGRFDVNLEHRRLGPSVNRLVIGMMSSAVFMGSSWMLAGKVPPLMFPGEGWLGIQDLSMFGVMGLVVSIMMGLRLVWSIRKSGNLDKSS